MNEVVYVGAEKNKERGRKKKEKGEVREFVLMPRWTDIVAVS
jgi:hypothetical protein